MQNETLTAEIRTTTIVNEHKVGIFFMRIEWEVYLLEGR